MIRLIWIWMRRPRATLTAFPHRSVWFPRWERMQWSSADPTRRMGCPSEPLHSNLLVVVIRCLRRHGPGRNQTSRACCSSNWEEGYQVPNSCKFLRYPSYSSHFQTMKSPWAIYVMCFVAGAKSTSSADPTWPQKSRRYEGLASATDSHVWPDICQPTQGTNLPGGSAGQACWWWTLHSIFWSKIRIHRMDRSHPDLLHNRHLWHRPSDGQKDFQSDFPNASGQSIRQVRCHSIL